MNFNLNVRSTPFQNGVLGLFLGLCLLGLSVTASAQEYDIIGISLTNEGVYYGFLRSSKGEVIQLSEPNADTTPGDFNGTYPMSLNNRGAVTGTYQKAVLDLHWFIRDPHGG